MNGDLILGLLKLFLPIASDVLGHYTRSGVAPTKDEMRAILNANADKYLDEWEAWNRDHPVTP